MKLIKLIVLLAFIFNNNMAYSEYKVFQRIDGSEIKLKIKGNESYSWKIDKEEYYICFNKLSSEYEYCICDSNEFPNNKGLVANGVRAEGSSNRYLSSKKIINKGLHSSDSSCIDSYISQQKTLEKGEGNE